MICLRRAFYHSLNIFDITYIGYITTLTMATTPAVFAGFDLFFYAARLAQLADEGSTRYFLPSHTRWIFRFLRLLLTFLVRGVALLHRVIGYRRTASPRPSSLHLISMPNFSQRLGRRVGHRTLLDDSPRSTPPLSYRALSCISRIYGAHDDGH